MKRTIYFTAPNHNIQELEVAVQNAVKKRDIWINENRNIIAKIDNEDIKITPWGNSYVVVTILLTYYPKES